MDIMPDILDLAVFPIDHPGVVPLPGSAVNHPAVGRDSAGHHPRRKIVSPEILLRHGQPLGNPVGPLNGVVEPVAVITHIADPIFPAERSSLNGGNPRHPSRSLRSIMTAGQIEYHRPGSIRVLIKDLSVVGDCKSTVKPTNLGLFIRAAERLPLSRLRVDYHGCIIPGVAGRYFGSVSSDVTSVGRHRTEVLKIVQPTETHASLAGSHLENRYLPGQSARGQRNPGTPFRTVGVVIDSYREDSAVLSPTFAHEASDSAVQSAYA